ncbi:MAG TPA: alpha-L-fucosidase, partial [Chitinophaga sp.]|uniref:alpha-L-fucosidase n=1 Tax=Chitinophaga sp. TaxID=1869181 RepID=UPI002F95FA0E
MKKSMVLLLCGLGLLLQLTAQEKKIFNETPEQKEQRLAWWKNDRFGMFIHWGLYA